ncbi:MAG: hypothetical protein CMJ32_12240 [Phycisphaerae bacterium]|nr:hypothetical protein [Phycisphaerae bacterium]
MTTIIGQPPTCCARVTLNCPIGRMTFHGLFSSWGSTLNALSRPSTSWSRPLITDRVLERLTVKVKTSETMIAIRSDRPSQPPWILPQPDSFRLAE